MNKINKPNYNIQLSNNINNINNINNTNTNINNVQETQIDVNNIDIFDHSIQLAMNTLGISQDRYSKLSINDLNKYYNQYNNSNDANKIIAIKILLKNKSDKSIINDANLVGNIDQIVLRSNTLNFIKQTNTPNLNISTDMTNNVSPLSINNISNGIRSLNNISKLSINNLTNNMSGNNYDVDSLIKNYQKNKNKF